MRKISVFLGILTFAMAVQVQAGTLLTIGSGYPEDHSVHFGLVRFAEIVEKESNGELVCEIYPNQQMGGDRELIEAVQLGNITISCPSTSPVAGFVKEFYVLDVPFMFSNREEAYAALDGEPGRMLLKTLETVNIKGLTFNENGFRNLTANREVLSPDDLRGVKIRVMENRIHLLTWSTYGANPTPMAFGELFTSLQQRTVDAQENPYELIFTNKFYEVQSNIMETNHIYTPAVLIINLEFFNGLTPGLQNAIMKAARESNAYQRRLAAQGEAKAKAEIAKSRPITVYTAEQRRAFVDKLAPVHAEAAKIVGNDALIKAFLK
jgi:tripartite ATP-independent transporter DctP family solute receptor